MRAYLPPTGAPQQQRPFGQPVFELDKFLAIYARQSTNDDIFDFNSPRRDDRKRFPDAAQAAADYVTKHVKGRMLPARAQLSLRGVADSRKISVGFIVVDRKRYLGDGSENPSYKRLV